MDSATFLLHLQRHLNENSRTRTVTMDSEDIEQMQANCDLVYEDTDRDVLGRLHTMRQNDKFCDVKLKVGSKAIPAHRAVLACSSTYLFDLFDSTENNCSDYIQLEGLAFDCVEMLVDYAYTGRLEVPSDRVKAVYKTATILKMLTAAEACSRFLAENLSTDNCLSTRSFANSHCDGDLTDRTDEYIQNNICDIVKSVEMQGLPTIQVEVMGVAQNELADDGEKLLAKMVVNWLEKALGERSFDALTEDRQVLYLTSDNNLRDCLDLADDDTKALNMVNSEIIQDYKKMGKRKKINPVKTMTIPYTDKASPPLNGVGFKRLITVEKSDTLEKEWKVIATECVGAQTYCCVAMLDDRITNLSLHFSPYPGVSPPGPQQNGGTAPGSASPTPNSSPRGSLSTLMEKQCSLTPLATMDTPRCAHGTAVLHDKLVVVGGYDRGECHSSVEIYDPKTNTWAEFTPMNNPRGRFDITQLGGRLYACGGSNGSQELKSVECYDPETGKWTEVCNMVSRRSSAGVTVLNNKLYVIGGWFGQSGVKDCEMYDPDLNKWTSIAKLNVGRAQAGVLTFQGKIWAIGGCDAWNPMNTVEVYDPEAPDKWVMTAPMNTNRRGVGTITFKDKVYAVGGGDGMTSLSTIEIYDPQTQNWSFGPQMSVPRANVSIAVINQRLYAVGGFSGKQFLDTIEYLTEDASEWCSFVPVNRGPAAALKISPGNADGAGDAPAGASKAEEDDVFSPAQQNCETSTKSSATEDVKGENEDSDDVKESGKENGAL